MPRRWSCPDTAIDFDSAEARVELLMEVAGEFRLDDDAALAVLGEVTKAATRWREVAKELGLDDGAIERMEGAFEHEEAIQARELAGVTI